MLDRVAAKDRAIRMAVVTGEMADFHLIHSMQKAEGFEACFGRVVEDCHQVSCRWRSQCMALMKFENTSQPAKRDDWATVCRPIFRSPREYRASSLIKRSGRRTTPRRRPPQSQSRTRTEELAESV